MDERDDFRTLMIAMLALCGIFLAATTIAFLVSGCGVTRGVRPLQSQRDTTDRWDPEEVQTCAAQVSPRSACDREISRGGVSKGP